MSKFYYNEEQESYDAIVIGTGISGGWAAKELCDSFNIVFFFVDDQTTSVLGCYGNDVVKTPQIDALAAGGTRFTNAFVSQSICWVSRTTILSGLTGRSFGSPQNPDAPYKDDDTPPDEILHRA